MAGKLLLATAGEISIPLLPLSTKFAPYIRFVLHQPKIPWQLTGNHWVSVPCIHPVDGSIYAVGVVHRGLRGAVEFAGDPGFVQGGGEPLLRLGIAVDGVSIDLASSRMAWQRISDWLPTFSAIVGEIVVRGTIFAPFGRWVDGPGLVYAISFENRGVRDAEIQFTPRGTLGLRQHRIITARPLDDAHAYIIHDDVVTLTGTSPTGIALAIAGEGAQAAAAQNDDGSINWSLAQRLVVPPGGRTETAIYAALGPERDGAAATLDLLRRRGWRTVAEATRSALGKLEQSTGIAQADRVMNRHLIFAYFYCVVRAIDDAQLYLVRTRVPWHAHGMTVRDWDALMWTIPAVQIADPDLARELILRMCEVHGYAPGHGVHYLDGTPFRSEFSLEGACAYAIAVDRYIAQTGDDRIVEEPALADSLYASYEDISAQRHATIPLFATDVTPSGEHAELPYTLHANAVVAQTLSILRHTLDEKTAENIEQGDIVRAALLRHFNTDAEGTRATLVAATDLQGSVSVRDDPVGSVYWIPMYDTLSRTDSTYRRTVKRLEIAGPPISVATECARLIGPDSAVVLERFRRAAMDNGFAAEYIDDKGDAVGNGGDAALSGLIAHSIWYVVHALGVRI